MKTITDVLVILVIPMAIGIGIGMAVELVRQGGNILNTLRVMHDWVVLPLDYARGDRYFMIRRLGALAGYRRKSLIFKIINDRVNYGRVDA